ncbi:MAG TPA: alpha-amylase family glycosyl hydrolase [Bryobacteraceae bacterium]|jgi:glycosidase
MPGFHDRPIIYEVNTGIWLNELSAKYQRRVTLDTVPSQEWDFFASFAVNSVWLMGIWKRSPEGRQMSGSVPDWIDEFRSILPDFKPDDVAGSPYCIQEYSVELSFGGPAALASARDSLKRRGLNLILDFVPNHVAPDHPWLTDHPEFFIQSENGNPPGRQDLFANINGRWLAHGRDPYFPPWPDTIQVNAFSPALRQAAGQTLVRIASQCDGVRCDMAMLLLNEVFHRTWGDLAGSPPPVEYWTETISTVRRQFPEFLFIAEAYWDLEWTLQQLGFNFCYDKRLYDRLVHENANSVRSHLRADLSYQNRLLRFLENHDEPRAARVFAPARHRAAATAVATLPGGKLYHDGEFTGRHTKVSVHLGRRPEEPVDRALLDFYASLLEASATISEAGGRWQLLEASGWPDNQSCQNILAWSWTSAERRFLVAVNFSDGPSQARILLPWSNLASGSWRLHDLMTPDVFECGGPEIASHGLYVDLQPWRSHVLSFERLG